MTKLTTAEQKKLDDAEAEKLKAEEEAKAAEAEKLKAEEEAKAAEAEKLKAEEEAKASKAGITVKNLRKTWFVQPSTQTRINVGATVLIADDGWARNQIDAGFFEVVK